MITIVITGGHHNSALVVARDLMERDVKIAWIGHRHSSRQDSSDSAEYIEVKASNITFYDLTAARFIASFKEIIIFPVGIFRALQFLRRIHPSAILSFGGYLGGTVALAGAMLNIPIYLHEQTVTAGRSNKLIAKLSRKVFLTWAESAKYFPPHKTEIIGLPLRNGVLSSKKINIFSRSKPTLLIMGGKQGSSAINHFIFNNINDLLMRFNIVHQTGTNSTTKDYEHAVALKNTLGSLSDSYLPLGYISESEIGGYLHTASYYLGRSGAHICYELCVVGLRAILVPLMSTHDHEQHKNATILTKANLGIILSESKLGLKNLFESIDQLNQLVPLSLDLPRNASKLLVGAILQDIK